MVCLRCKIVVEWTLNDLGIKYANVQLGVAELIDTLSTDKYELLNTTLKKYDLELMGDRKQIMVENIKSLIRQIFLPDAADIPQKFSEYLSKAMLYDYTYLSNIYTEVEGSTIERYFIVTRIERVKELMVYENFSITEIAYHLNYSSVSHLCLQFKKVTGHTPAKFKKLIATPDFTWRDF